MTLLEQTREAFANVRGSIVYAMQKLYAIHETGEWKQREDDTWGGYVEQELGISQGFASKLLTVNKHYLLGGIPAESLEGIDYEKLYLAAKTEGTPEEQVAKARTLTRRELKEEKNDEEPHEHIPVSICKTCSLRL